MHWRFYMDPPEFFTIAHGDSDGLHWGYWFDAPGERAPVVCSYYNNDAYEITECGDSIVDAAEDCLTATVEGLQENLEDDPEESEYYNAEIARIEDLQRGIREWRWPSPTASQRKANVPTFDGMGLIVPDALASDLLPPEKLYRRAESGDGHVLLAEARTALANGRLGVALQVARAVWTFEGSKEYHSAASLLQADVYAALNRPALASVARVQAAHRGITSVDLLRER
jgi:hypothetical protein